MASAVESPRLFSSRAPAAQGSARLPQALFLLAVLQVEYRHLALFLVRRAPRQDLRRSAARPGAAAWLVLAPWKCRRQDAELDSPGRAQFVFALWLAAGLRPDLLAQRRVVKPVSAWPAEMAGLRQAAFARHPEKLLPPELCLA